MALPEIESGEYEFRIVYINSNDETEVEYDDYTVHNRDGLKNRLELIEKRYKLSRGAKEIVKITHKRLL